jgi:hypothetical protein
MNFMDPLQFLHANYGYDSSLVKQVVPGEIYTAVELNDGSIGVCSGLSGIGNQRILNIGEPKLANLHHRLFLSAYYSALLNYRREYKENADMVDSIDFSVYQAPVMIGYSKPLVKRIEGQVLRLRVFDHHKDDEALEPMSEQADACKNADCIIATATTIFNNSFGLIVKEMRNDCDLLLFGPSSILDTDMQRHFRIKNIFGMTFHTDKQKLLSLVKKGGGAQEFKHLGTRVYI